LNECSQTRTSSLNIPNPFSCQWPTPEKTPTDLSSSSPPLLLHGWTTCMSFLVCVYFFHRCGSSDVWLPHFSRRSCRRVANRQTSGVAWIFLRQGFPEGYDYEVRDYLNPRRRYDGNGQSELFLVTRSELGIAIRL
jgi:hypothetical protein